MIADRVEDFPVAYPESMLRDVCARVLVHNGGRHARRRRKALETGRIGREIFRAVVKERGRKRPFFVYLQARRPLRRQNRHADAVGAAGGLFEVKRLFRMGNFI